MQHSNHANHVIEEEDYQQSSHAQFGKLGASFVANEENQVIRTQQQFKTQKADFEARSHASETASDGRQPSHLQRSGYKNPFRLSTRQTGGHGNTQGSALASEASPQARPPASTVLSPGMSDSKRAKTHTGHHNHNHPDADQNPATNGPTNQNKKAGHTRQSENSPPDAHPSGRPSSSDYIFSSGAGEDYARLQMQRHMRNQHRHQQVDDAPDLVSGHR